MQFLLKVKSTPNGLGAGVEDILLMEKTNVNEETLERPDKQLSDQNKKSQNQKD